MQKKYYDLTENDRMSKENDNCYREIQKKGVDFFKPGLELFDLHKAYLALLSYSMEEKYEECDVIKRAIHGLLSRESKVLENSIDKLEKNWKRLYGNGD